jgi:hypothetical protein
MFIEFGTDVIQQPRSPIMIHRAYRFEPILTFQAGGIDQELRVIAIKVGVHPTVLVAMYSNLSMSLAPATVQRATE